VRQIYPDDPSRADIIHVIRADSADYWGNQGVRARDNATSVFPGAIGGSDSEFFAFKLRLLCRLLKPLAVIDIHRTKDESALVVVGSQGLHNPTILGIASALGTLGLVVNDAPNFPAAHLDNYVLLDLPPKNPMSSLGLRETTLAVAQGQQLPIRRLGQYAAAMDRRGPVPREVMIPGELATNLGLKGRYGMFEALPSSVSEYFRVGSPTYATCCGEQYEGTGTWGEVVTDFYGPMPAVDYLEVPGHAITW
jgi:hypothetical protein